MRVDFSSGCISLFLVISDENGEEAASGKQFYVPGWVVMSWSGKRGKFLKVAVGGGWLVPCAIVLNV
jgi:hypothetical protein